MVRKKEILLKNTHINYQEMKKAQLILTLFITILLGYNCTAKEKATRLDVTEETAFENGDHEMANPAQNRLPRYGATPQDSIKCVRNISLYTEYYNQGNRQLAFEPWREVFLNCPQAQQNTFIRGAILVRMMYSQETDIARKDAWIDTLMMVYDQRIKYFGQMPAHREGLVLARKAVDLYQLRPNDILNIYEIARRSVELEKNASQADILLVYFQSLIRMVEAGLKPQGDILLAYDEIMGIIEHNLRANAQDQLFDQAKNNVELMFEPYATCENIVALFGPRIESNPNDVALLEKVTSMLNRSNCNDSKLFFTATRNLHRLKPTAQSAFLMGRMESSNENYREALRYYDQAIELYPTEAEKFTALLLAADITYRQFRQFPQARNYILRAAQADPKNARPYILLGEMYAASAPQCGDNDLTKSVAYWAAVDKFIQARNIAAAENDQQIQERASQLISTYSQYFPSKDIIFFHGLSEGDTYRVECWINETTRIRSR
jgi:tetratricopeptide (TPR) repeat protein